MLRLLVFAFVLMGMNAHVSEHNPLTPVTKQVKAKGESKQVLKGQKKQHFQKQKSKLKPIQKKLQLNKKKLKFQHNQEELPGVLTVTQETPSNKETSSVQQIDTVIEKHDDAVVEKHAIVEKHPKISQDVIVEKHPEMTQDVLDFISSVCVAIPSARRYAQNGQVSPDRYLTNLIEGLYAGLSPESAGELTIHIMNVDRDPNGHDELFEVSRKYPAIQIKDHPFSHDEVETKVPSSFFDPVDKQHISKEKQVWRAKEVLDNAALLGSCKSSGKKFTLFLEDDVKATSHIWAKLKTFVMETVPNNYAFLTLYNPSSWEGDKYENGAEYSYFCCTQALFFDNSRIDPILSFLEKEFTNNPVDHLLVDYLKIATTNNHVYVSVPSLFQHVGSYSTLAERTQFVPTVQHESRSWENVLIHISSAYNNSHSSITFQE